MIAQAAKIVFQLGALVILARLLPPRAFGLIAMTASINAVLDIVKELGLSSATIQKQDISQDQVSLLFWINAGAGVGIAALLFLLAPTLAKFYHEPAITEITRTLAVGFVISGLSIQHWALLRRQMRFMATALLDNGADVTSLALAVAIALDGGGYWALVAQRLIQPSIVLIGSWYLCKWRPGRPRKAEGAAVLLRLGGALTLSNVFFAFSRSIDQVFVGWLWGPVQLGFYERAAKLALTPLLNIQIPIYSVGMPVLSRLVNEPEQYRRGFNVLLQTLSMFLVPAAILVAVSSRWVVDILFGQEWGGIEHLVGWFAMAAAVQPLATATSLLFLSQNRANEVVRASMIDAGLCVASFLIGLPFGITAVAASFAVVAVVVRTPVTFWLVSRRGAVTLGDLWSSVYPGLVAGSVVAVLCWRARITLEALAFKAVGGTTILFVLAAAASLTVYFILPKSRAILLRGFVNGSMRQDAERGMKSANLAPGSENCRIPEIQ
jgi:polysaccharide transporter, PST family